MWLDDTLEEHYGMMPYGGDIGIEVEMESNEDPFPMAPVGWKSTFDGSLKALYTVEYVTTNELTVRDAKDAVERLRKRVSKITLADTVRAGVHVHVNARDMKLRALYRFILLYLTMEIPLVKFCGPSREGNLFCLRAVDAEYLVNQIYSSLVTQKLSRMASNGEAIRYSSINLNAISKYGSVEFRAMQTLPGLEKLDEWIDILYRLKNYAISMENTVDIAYKISAESPSEWMKGILGEENFNLINYDGLDRDVMRGLRLIQPIIYSGV